MKRVIITGGTGFIGQRLVKELLKKDVEVVLLSKSVEIKLEEVLKDKVTIVPVKSYLDALNDVEKGFDVFYHLGWAGVDSKKKNDVYLQLDNIKNSIEAMSVSKELKCQKFIGGGTVAEYTFNENEINPSLKQTPNDMYGAAKVATHYMLEVYAKNLELNMIWAILPSTFGEGRRTDNILTYTICKLLKREVPLYGDLEQMWDFLYVEEVARALVKLGERGLPGVTYGIGSGQYHKLKEYIMQIRDMIDPSLELGIGRLETNSNFSSCVNIERLMMDTGFVPQISFEEGMRRTIAYYRDKEDGAINE